jgi:pilus assembly protein CpaC
MMQRPGSVSRVIAAAVAAALVLSAPSGGWAQAPAGQQGAQIAVQAPQAVPVQRITLPLGKSAVVDLPVDARDVVISDPTVADAVMRTSRRAFILGSKNGETNIFFLDGAGRQILTLEVRVARDTSELDALIQRFAPDARVTAEGVGDSIILSGNVPTNGDADRILRVAQQYAGGADKVVNMMNVLAGDTVYLRVRVVEMQRTVIKQLGVNLNTSNILNQLLPDDWGLRFATANGFAVNGNFLGGTSIDASWARNFIRPIALSYLSGPQAALLPSVPYAGAGGYSSTIDPNTGIETRVFPPGELVSDRRTDASVQALERVGLARTLAEPVLTAVSGSSATFLAGGEFPVPVSQEGSRISVEFKPFGVGLGFTPVVLGPNRISLKVSTEVSEISSAASFRQPDTVIRNSAGLVTDTIRGLSIPGVSTRKAETTLELPSGRSMIMAGLIQSQTRQAIEGVPGLKDLPVLGNLFRSRDFANNETELVIIITPYLVQSAAPGDLQTPGDGYAAASDGNALLLGRLNRIVRPDSAGRTPGRYQGPIGHVTR